MKIINGNVIKAFKECKEYCVLIHIVNNKGVFGAGFAKALSSSFPITKVDYQKRLDELTLNGDNLLGAIGVSDIDGKEIIHLYAQDGYGRDKNKQYLSYDSLIRCLNKVKFRLKLDIETKKLKNVKIIMPYLIGCGLANGDETIVKSIIDLAFEDFKEVDVIAYRP